MSRPDQRPKRLKVGTRLTVTVEALDASGLGRGRVDLASGSAPVLVEDGLPGEVGEAVVLYAGRTPVLRLLRRRRTAAERRAQPLCPRWTPRSPCRLMHLCRTAQLEFKRARVRAAFAAHGIEVEVAPVEAPSPPLGWRASATFIVARHEGTVVLGAYRRRTHVVQPMEACPLHEGPITRAALALRTILEAQSLPLANPQPPVASDDACGGPGEPAALLEEARGGPPGSAASGAAADGLKYVAMRASGAGRVAVALLSPSGRLPGADRVAEALRAAVPAVASVSLGHSGPGDVIFGDGALVPLAGEVAIEEVLGGHRFLLTPRLFFQVNRLAAEYLHGRAKAAAGGGCILELYAGVGALTLRLAGEAQRVVAVERVGPAVRAARQAAAEAGLAERVHFIEADAAALFSGDARRLQEALGGRGSAGAAVLNPPRKGCAPAVLDGLARLGVPRIVYVSCNPDTLARDVARLCAAGYGCVRAEPVDLFPESEHVEVLAVLERTGSAASGPA